MSEVLLVEVEVATADFDLCCGELWAAGAAAIEERAGHAPDRVLLVAGTVDGNPEPLVQALGGRPHRLVPPPPGWRDAWRAHARPARVGSLVVVPAWVSTPATHHDDVVIVIDPGETFGSGAHASTQLVLELLSDELATTGPPPDPRRVSPEPGRCGTLDVGCGSGVLAVAAARLGASPVRAIDVDPNAVRATEANAATNGVTVEADTTPLAEITTGWTLVVANLLAPVLRELAPDLVRVTAPGGALVIAGLLEDQVESVVPLLAPFEITDRRRRDRWVGLRLAHPDAASAADAASA